MSKVREIQRSGIDPLKTSTPFTFLVLEPPFESTLQANPALCSGSPIRSTPLTDYCEREYISRVRLEGGCRVREGLPELLGPPLSCLRASTVAAAPLSRRKSMQSSRSVDVNRTNLSLAVLSAY